MENSTPHTTGAICRHSNGNPLDLAALLSFKPQDFTHDVIGISLNINRETGQLQNCFLPRCAKKEEQTP